MDEESDSAPADEAKSDLEGVGTKVTSPARPGTASSNSVWMMDEVLLSVLRC